MQGTLYCVHTNCNVDVCICYKKKLSPSLQTGSSISCGYTEDSFDKLFWPLLFSKYDREYPARMFCSYFSYEIIKDSQHLLVTLANCFVAFHLASAILRSSITHLEKRILIWYDRFSFYGLIECESLWKLRHQKK